MTSMAQHIEELSASLRRHAFESTKEAATIHIKEGKAEKAAPDTRRKQGAEFWADFSDVVAALSGDGITTHSTTLEHLEQRHNGLLAQTTQLKQQANTRSSDLYLDARIHELQEENERAWEAQMEAGKQSLERMEAQLTHVQTEIDGLDASLQQAQPPDRATVLRENQKLRDVLMLRAEEKDDLSGALGALKRKQADRAARAHAHAAEPSQALQDLKAQRDRLCASIRDLSPSDNSALAPLEEEAQQLRLRLQRAQEKLNAREASATALKTQMRKLVAVKAAGAHVAALVLQALYDHDGEWTKKDLQTQVAAAAGVEESHVIRALYSLVASGLVHLDRSHAHGLVTSLLV
ncbi:Aste57867_2171 [Aphanomyces stellatus]|uniref:Aste57867_2171 protein n=1 Tax=Aphanomyces stellatus TaxID=120398 RepID=A0A485K722_9STRA|nr:hypothetical protein As57867_002166 [Aphanomyces stellatus]VFT79374.1 Aste57867_2171 [Aphanomyces stellatus]